MSKRIATVTLMTRVSVPDDYTTEQLEALRSGIQHYDLKGAVREAVAYATNNDPRVEITVGQAAEYVTVQSTSITASYEGW